MLVSGGGIASVHRVGVVVQATGWAIPNPGKSSRDTQLIRLRIHTQSHAYPNINMHTQARAHKHIHIIRGMHIYMGTHMCTHA